MSDDERAARRAALREEAIAAHREAIEASIAAPEVHDVGYDETLPGQVEVVAGSVEHEKLLQPLNVSHYADVHNVVIPDPPEGSTDPQAVETSAIDEEEDRGR
jgi:hypothetical protein